MRRKRECNPRLGIILLGSKIEDLQKQLAAEVLRVYPVHSKVKYTIHHRQHGLHTLPVQIEAVVTRHGYGTDVWIRNFATGVERRVDGASASLSPASE